MPDLKISQLPVATTPLAGTELVPIVQGGVTDQTTVQAIMTSTVPSGTANGVLYLNGSKVATSGSALVFDGSNLGLGVTPSAWLNYKALQIAGGNALVGFQSSITGIHQNDYFDGTERYYATGTAAAKYLLNTGTHAWYTAPSGTAGNAISFTQAMTLSASGYLGVGITNPANRIDVREDVNYPLSWGSTSAISGILSYASGVAIIGGVTSTALGLLAGGSEKARITSGGDLLVGTTESPSGLNKNGVEISNGSSIGRINIGKSVTGSQFATVYYYNGSAVGNISYTDTATAYNTSSDYRLKDNPQPLTNSGAFIDALQPKTWEWKADGSRGVGFIAHEAQAVSPSSVVGEKDAVDAGGKPVMQAMEYGSAEFIANIIAELKALRARVAALEAQP